MLAAEMDQAFRKSPFRESGYTGIHQDIFYLLWATNMPSVLLELGFISNPSDYKYLSSADGQEKIAQRLFEAFKTYKTNFDASMNVVSEPVSLPVELETPAEAKPEVQVSGVHYGVQIMGLGRILKKGDSALKGLDVEILPPAEGGKIYKYVAAWSDSLEGAKAQLAAVRKKFPDAFLVKVEGNDVSRVK